VGILERLGADLPVVAAPMAGGASTPALVVAAHRAGALGFLAGGYKSPDALDAQVEEVRATGARFGVNLFVPNPQPVDRDAYAAYAAALRDVAEPLGVDPTGIAVREDDDDFDAKVALLVRDPVPLVSFTFGFAPVDVVEELHAVGTLAAQTVTTVDEAAEAAGRGVDMLVVQSHEAGAHSGTTDPSRPAPQVALEDLVAAVRNAADLPVWAAGGIADADRVRSVLRAGAEAAMVGTVLLRTPESGTSETHKRALADPARTETRVTTAFSGRPARALRNGFTDRYAATAPRGYPAVHHLTSPLRKAAAAAGDAEALNLWAGTGWRQATAEPAEVVLRRLGGAPDRP
jgi:NAD(P)H-dependent flavin oxidoreductase YrpB (nitropropane dioxygenase family)